MSLPNSGEDSHPTRASVTRDEINEALEAFGAADYKELEGLCSKRGILKLSQTIGKIRHQLDQKDSDPTMVEPEAVSWPSRCTWTPDPSCSALDPHRHAHVNYYVNRASHIHDSILDAIGQTPLVRLNSLPRALGVKCQIFAKCEFMNPGGSVKDRIAQRMVEDAEREGLLEPFSGYTIIEPTSGNTGIGLAMVAAVKGYRCIIVMPEKMSKEKEVVLRALGAEIVRTPTEARYNDKDSHIARAIELCKATPKSVILNQYRSSGNPLVHYDTTAEEILVACNNKVDLLVAGAGTGGTLTGIARKFKTRLPDCKIVGVDPVGSVLAEPSPGERPLEGPYEIEGIGYDFVPTVLDRSLVDIWVKTRDVDSVRMARLVIKLEGLLAGGSSGAALSAAFRALDDLNMSKDPTKRVVVVLPDGVRNYMSKFIDDDWMRQRKFL